MIVLAKFVDFDCEFWQLLLHSQIDNTNDSPRVEPRLMAAFDNNPRSMLRVALVPLDLAENTGVLVGDVVSEFFEDPEDTPLGMCVALAQTSGECDINA